MGVVRRNAIRVESRLLTATHDNESVTACLAIGKLAPLSSFVVIFLREYQNTELGGQIIAVMEATELSPVGQ
ncbi:hypothetical protein [Edaphobacter modestus]|uniref:hypothetical protein n=1 Tax=Edaphobacter modestus TaxID=388466 RepID=UPI00102CD46C|nr:hypothetical protein [Edaphobacter modestus]